MRNSIWKKVAALAPVGILAGFAVASYLLPDVDISKTERRHLKKKTEISEKTLLDGSYMKELEDYFKDHIAGREWFRTAKAELETSLLGKMDTSGYYQIDDNIYRLDTEFSEKNVTRAAENFSKIAETYFSQSEIYVSIIPDKNYYVPEEMGYPCLDYVKMENLLLEKMPEAEYISLFEMLEIEDYYRTDPHWRQECIGDVAELLLDTMLESKDSVSVLENGGIEGNVLSEDEFKTNIATETFLGGYAGASAFLAEPEPFYYVTDSAMENAVVYDYEKQENVDIYAWEKLDGTDPYDFYLWGARALLTIENPMMDDLEKEDAERNLIIFRDSFGSSIAPLILKDYNKITLVDLRYVSMNYVEKLLVNTEDYEDVLFLYSGSMLNHSNSMRF